MKRKNGWRGTVPWVARLLTALMCASGLLAASAGAAVARDQPASAVARRAGSATLQEDRADGAAELQAAVALRREVALGAAAVAFALAAFGLWWLSAHWLRQRAVHWASLIAIPTSVALAVIATSRGAVLERLDELPASQLREDLKDPFLSAEPERRAAIRHALSLHAASNQDHLLGTLALRTTSLAAGGALLLTLLLWQLSHRRVLQPDSSSQA